MKKTVAMIPARMGSKRVKFKNIRLINKIPLISYIINAAKESGCFDEIYINSESDILGEIADEHGIKFYKRPKELSSDTATNDDFVLDFINNVECKTLIQLLPTSPFLTPNEIKEFVNEMDNVETLISTKNEQIECVFNGSPINFEQKGQTLPSQQLTPIKVYACGIMGWDSDVFVKNMEKYNSGYHGGDGSIGYFTLKGFSTIDVDNEEDFKLAEMIAGSKSLKNEEPQYYSINKKETIEAYVPKILEKDGVMKSNFSEENTEIRNIRDVIRKMGKASWCDRMVNTENNSATLICQNPGEGNRLHYHNDWNEWWYIVDGEWEFEIEGEKKVVKKDDLVFIRKNRKHKIKAIGNKPAIRLAVSREDVGHIYDNDEKL